MDFYIAVCDKVKYLVIGCDVMKVIFKVNRNGNHSYRYVFIL